MERLSGRIILLWGWRRALVAFLAGALLVLTAAPYDFFAAGFISFPVLVWLLDGAVAESSAGRLRRLMPAFATGWWFGFGYFLVGLWWVGTAMLFDAENYAWAIPFTVILLPAVLALFYGFAAALARLAWSDGLGRLMMLAGAFAVGEWLRSFLFTGFPWNPVGYAAMPIPLLMQSVWVVGTVGMNALVVFVFSVPALLAARQHRVAGFALAGLLIAAHAGYGLWRLGTVGPDTAPPLALRIVQPSIEQSAKIDRTRRDDIFRTLLELSAQAPAADRPKPALILWPETSVPFLFTDRPDGLTAIAQLLDEGQALMAGVVREEEGSGAAQGSRYYNSVVLIDAAGTIVDAVDKLHLVPGGEYMPFHDLLKSVGVERLVPIPENFSAGTTHHALAAAPGVRAAPFICYEIIFPDLVREGIDGANLIVNLTNDAWFGDTPGPYQHLRQAQIRAVETALPLVRAANTGISAAIDSRGRILDALAVDSRGVLDISLSLASDGQPKVPSGWVGLALMMALLVFGAVMSGARRRID